MKATENNNFQQLDKRERVWMCPWCGEEWLEQDLHKLTEEYAWSHGREEFRLVFKKFKD